MGVVVGPRCVVDKVAFNVGGIDVYWYGLLVGAGLLLGLKSAARRGAGAGLSADAVVDLGLALMLGGLAGARVLYVMTYWDEFQGESLWAMLNIRAGGLVYYGGFGGAVVAGYAFAQWRKLPFWRTADVMIPSVPLAHVFGRAGCLVNGCCYGRPTEMPWALHYPSGHETMGLGVHPTQAYEAAMNLGLFLVLERVFRRKRFEGQVFAIYLVGYAMLRGVAELFRGDYGNKLIAGFVTPGQFVSAAIFAVGVAVYSRMARRGAGGANA